MTTDPVVGKNTPEPAVPYHVGTTRLEETVNIRTRSVGRAVRRPYSESEESDNDVVYTEEYDSELQQISLRNEWPTQMTVDSCGERCTQLDDFKWFLSTDRRVEDLGTPESKIDTSDSEDGVYLIDSDSPPLQMESATQQLLCPPVVAHMRPKEGCHPAAPRRLRRGRDVRTADNTVAADVGQDSAASDTVVSRKTHRKSECVTMVAPGLAAAPQAAYGIVQSRRPDYSHGSTQIRCDLRHTHDISAVTDCYTGEPNDMIFRHTSFPPENVSAGRDKNDGSPKIDCAAVKLNDLTFHRMRLPPGDVSVERDGNYGSPRIDSAVIELNDLIIRRPKLPPEDCRRMGYFRG